MTNTWLKFVLGDSSGHQCTAQRSFGAKTPTSWTRPTTRCSRSSSIYSRRARTRWCSQSPALISGSTSGIIRGGSSKYNKVLLLLNSSDTFRYFVLLLLAYHWMISLIHPLLVIYRFLFAWFLWPIATVMFLQRVGTAGREDDGHDLVGARGSKREVRGAARRAETHGPQLGVLGEAAGEGAGRKGASNAHQGQLTILLHNSWMISLSLDLLHETRNRNEWHFPSVRG